jgi:hypothetical protein
MHCAESVTLLLDELHESKTKIFGKNFLDGPLGRRSPGTDPFDSMKYVIPYTKRYLTFGEDKINAKNAYFMLTSDVSTLFSRFMLVMGRNRKIRRGTNK